MHLRKLGAIVVCAAAALAVADDLTTLRQGFINDNAGARLMETGPRVTRVYGAAFGFGGSAEETADQFRRDYAEMFGVNPNDLHPGNPLDQRLTQPVLYDSQTDSYTFTLVYYRQFLGEIPVYRASMLLLVRNEPGFPLVWVNPYVRDLGDFSIDPALKTLEATVFANLAQDKVGELTNFTAELTNFTAPRSVIWAGVDDMVVEPRLAVEIIGDNGNRPDQDPQKWLFIMDAATGQVLHTENLILNFSEVSGTVRGNATVGIGADACNPESAVPMPYARVSVGSTVVFADENGFYSHDPGGAPVTVTSTIRGRWFRVENQAGGNASLSQGGNPPNVVDFLHNAANTSEFNRAEVNGYVQANIVRDFTLSFNPSYPVIANQTNFLVNVNIASTCNAFYNGTSINFYRAGGGCNNTAFDSVVHHEYGHHLVAVIPGGGQGAYGEGLGDTMGVLILDDPRVGVGFQSCAGGIRNADNNLQYPCNGAIHFCGQLLSGCVWSTRTELLATNPGTYREIIGNLAVNAIILHSGSGIAPDITIDFLTLDDDDGNIGNGTPHYAEIAAGFGAHNMDAPPLELLEFDYPSGRPDVIDPDGGTTLRVEVLSNSGDPQPGTGRFFYDVGDGFVEGVMNEVTPNVYDAVFPSADCGSVVNYYLSAETTDQQVQTDPNDAPASSFSALSAVSLTLEFADDFNSDLGWTVQNADGLSDGAWERGVPITNCDRGNPGSDFDGSGWCFLTDNSSANNCNSDVDNGTTHLISPAFDLSGVDAVISYARWYSNTQGSRPMEDIFVVAVSNDDGGSYQNVEVVGPGGPEVDGGWFTHRFVVSDFVTPTSQVRVRFSASDLPMLGSVVEAGVDAFRLETIECDPVPGLGDMNCDLEVNAFDIEPFILAIFDPDEYELQYPDCDINLGDINGDGSVNSFDIEGFVNLLFP